jgi:hypothetical protein
MISLCEGTFVVFNLDAMNLLCILSYGSPGLKLNALARKLFWYGLEHRGNLNVEWVPREKTTLADELYKLLILGDSM